jgi:hypothetical protein
MLTGEDLPEKQEVVETNDVFYENRDFLEENNVIYLSGPIRKVADDGREWRNSLIEDYKHEHQFVNPLDRYDPGEEQILSDPKNFDEESDVEQILPEEYVADDKLGILKSEYVFVGLPEVISRGTLMECTFAYFTDTPFFVWEMDGQTESGWLYHHAEFVGTDRDEVMREIKNYD